MNIDFGHLRNEDVIKRRGHLIYLSIPPPILVNRDVRHNRKS